MQAIDLILFGRLNSAEEQLKHGEQIKNQIPQKMMTREKKYLIITL